MTQDATVSPYDETPDDIDHQTQGETPTTPGTRETQAPKVKQATSVEDAQREIERLARSLFRANSEAKNYREKATELDALKKRIEEETLSKTELLQKQLAEEQAQHNELKRIAQERAINAEVRWQAAHMGIVDPDAAARLLDRRDIELASDGTPINVDQLLKQLVKDKPYLAGQQRGGNGAAPSSSGGATNPSRSSTTQPKELSWDYLGQITAEEYQSRASEIQRWIMKHPPRYR